MTTPDLRRDSASSVDRRAFLGQGARFAGAALIGAPLLVGSRTEQAADSADPYGGFKMGLQSYSLRAFDAKTALEHTRKLGLKYWESYPKHVPMSTLPAHVEEQKKILADAGVTLMGYGVVSFDADETRSRAVFDFAKAMGLPAVSANPKKDKATFDLLDKLVAEYGVAVAIHNHGPKALYDKIDDVVQIVRDRHPKIGACVDTGHYLRSSENPVEAITRLKGRVFGVHLKDVRGAKVMTVLGEGDLDVVGCLRELRAQKYEGIVSLEYEENAQNPLSDIEVCLKNVRAAVAKLG